MTYFVEGSQGGTPRLSATEGEGDGIFGTNDEILGPKDKEEDKNEELKVLVCFPPRHD